MSSPIKFIKLDWVLSLSLHANRLLMGPPHQSILNTQLLLNLRDSKKLKLKLGLPLPINYIREEFMLHYASVLFTEVFLRCSIFFLWHQGISKSFQCYCTRTTSHIQVFSLGPLSPPCSGLRALACFPLLLVWRAAYLSLCVLFLPRLTASRVAACTNSPGSCCTWRLTHKPCTFCFVAIPLGSRPGKTETKNIGKF